MHRLHKFFLWVIGKVSTTTQVPGPAEYFQQLKNLYAQSGMPEEEQRELLMQIESDYFYNWQTFRHRGMTEEEAAQASIRLIDFNAKPITTSAIPQTQHAIADPYLVAWCILFSLVIVVSSWQYHYAAAAWHDCYAQGGVVILESFGKFFQAFSILILPPTCGVILKCLAIQRYRLQPSYSVSSLWNNLRGSLPESSWEFILTLAPTAICTIFAQILAVVAHIQVVQHFGPLVKTLVDGGYITSDHGWVLVWMGWGEHIVCLILWGYVFAGIVNWMMHRTLVTAMVQRMIVWALSQFNRSLRPPRGK